MQFLYYIPGESANDAAVDAAGIAYAFGGRAPATRQCKGPDGGKGFVLAYAADGIGEIGYFPERHTWERIPGSVAWIGYDPAARPTPDDLARPGIASQAHNVYMPELGDGHRWRVPTALAPDADGAPVQTLPRVRRIDRETGAIIRVVEARYEPLLLMADEVWEMVGSDRPLDDAREWEIALAALAANYRVSDIEIDLLGLLTDAAIKLVFVALVSLADWPRMRALVEAQEA